MPRRESFEYHAPTAPMIRRIQDVRDGCNTLADVIEAAVPDSAERTLALRSLEETFMRCSQAIVFGGRNTLKTPPEVGEPMTAPAELSRFVDNHPARQSA